jgi:hypothetical protein
MLRIVIWLATEITCELEMDETGHSFSILIFMVHLSIQTLSQKDSYYKKAQMTSKGTKVKLLYPFFIVLQMFKLPWCISMYSLESTILQVN